MRKTLAGIVIAALMATTAAAQEAAPLVQRIRIATVGTSTPEKTAAWYQKWLGYRVVETGKVGESLAKSWNAPRSAGKPYSILASVGTPDVYVRIVAIDPVPGFKADTTYGWNSIEIIVDDLDKLEKEMKAGDVHFGREKAALDAPFATIHAMQIHGTAEEIINLASETGDRAKSNLPVPKSQVDRIFLVSGSGTDVDALRNYWIDTFKMKPFDRFDLPIPIVARAMGLPDSTIFPSTLVRSAQRGNTVELHAFPPPAKARPRPDGQLPPGVAIASFAVKTFNGLTIPFVTAPTQHEGAAYNGKRAATTIGPAGELIELIEE